MRYFFASHGPWMREIAWLVSVALALAGCTVVGPDFEKPEDGPLPADWSPEETDETTRDVSSWWKLFNDPVLDTLITKAYEQNLTLQAAGLRILQARAALGIADGLKYPQQQAVSGNLARIYEKKDSLNSATLVFDVGWEMDVWGKFARNIESAEATLYASVASYDDILVSLTAEAATNYINYRTFQERMTLARQNIAIQQRVVELTQAQFESGNVSELDVQQAKTQLHTTQATLPAVTNSMINTRNALAALLGMLPQDVESLLAQGDKTLGEGRYQADFSDKMTRVEKSEDILTNYDKYSIVPIAPELSLMIDASLVRRRPDIQIAELLARAQNARIGVATAELYPSFSLFGTIGLSETVPAGSGFSFDNAVSVAAGPAFNWNIFQYGRVKNQIRVQDALFQESLTNYNDTVIRAVQEVADALSDYQYSRVQRDYNYKAVIAAIRAFNISVTQYNNGLVTYQRVLSTTEKMTRNEDAYAQIKGRIATSVVAVYQALGGSWQMRTGKPFVPGSITDQMAERTDWGEFLDQEKAVPTERKP